MNQELVWRRNGTVKTKEIAIIMESKMVEGYGWYV